MSSFVSRHTGHWVTFDRLLGRPRWRGRRVLDFGGNAGAILDDPRAPIQRHLYCCIDVSRDAITEGRRRFPRATWIFYDRYNYYFNPLGQPGLAVPDPGDRFDFVIAYSVFTHIDRHEMCEIVERLCTFLSAEGVLAWTFFDPHFRPFGAAAAQTVLEWRLAAFGLAPRRIRELSERARGARWCTVVDGRDLLIEDEAPPATPPAGRRGFLTLYSSAFLRQLFPYGLIRKTGGAQHGCVITRADFDAFRGSGAPREQRRLNSLGRRSVDAGS